MELPRAQADVGRSDGLVQLARQFAIAGTAHVVDGDTIRVHGACVSEVGAPELSQKCGPAGRQVA